MQISPVNRNYQNNNTNFKARFKPNALFNKHYEVATKEISKDSLNKFRNLPDHELEILSVLQDKLTLTRTVELFNHTTKKNLMYFINNNAPTLEGLINEINADTGWLFRKEDKLIDVYNKLTQ